MIRCFFKKIIVPISYPLLVKKLLFTNVRSRQKVNITTNMKYNNASENRNSFSVGREIRPVLVEKFVQWFFLEKQKS